MVVGILQLKISVFDAMTLKDKRRVIKSIKLDNGVLSITTHDGVTLECYDPGAELYGNLTVCVYSDKVPKTEEKWRDEWILGDVLQ